MSNSNSSSPNSGNTLVGSGLSVGQTVWVKEISYRNNEKQEVSETIIVSVGKKYFELQETWRGRFYKDTLLHDGKGYSPRYRVYLDKQQYENEKEISELSDKIKKAIGQHGDIKLPLEKLRAIWDLVRP